MKNEMFQSARDFAKRGIKSEAAVRREIEQGIVPGFRVGNRFKINVEQYLAMIDTECRRNAEGGKCLWTNTSGLSAT